MVSKTAIAMACLCVAGVAAAADAPRSVNGLAELTVRLKPGTNATYEEYRKAMKSAADKTKSASQWRIGRMLTGSSNVYVIDRGFDSWEQFAAPGPDLEAAFGKAEAKRLQSLIQSSVESASTAVYTIRTDLSRPFPANRPVPAGVTHVYISVKPGMQARFESAVKKLVAATAATAKDEYWLTGAPGAGADGRYLVIDLNMKWTDLDTPGKSIPQRFTEHLGAAEGQLVWAELQGTIDRLETVIGRPLPDLSRVIN
jgi:hypothetical protein